MPVHENQPDGLISPPAKKPLSSVKKKPVRRRKKTFGWPLTLLMWAVLLAMMACLWALFISGPSRIYDEQTAQVEQVIRSQVENIEGLSRNSFEYVTWQGYTDQTLYWFDKTGGEITTRELSTLDYEGARQKAAQQYGMEADTVSLAYGYSGPVYQLESDSMILMLDYDTLDWVYERNVNA